MFHNQRLIWNTTEVSAELNDFRSGTKSFAYATETYFYVGQEKPFNNLWIEPQTGNVSGAAVAVEIWYANAWHAAVDVSDGTVSGSASLAQAGRIAWNTSWQKSWDFVDRASLVTGLSSFEIYDLYWTRLSWDANLSAGTVLKYIGQKFASETELVSFYADLRQTGLKTAFGGNTKTTWDTELYIATDQVINDLKARKIIDAKGQIVDWSVLVEPCCHKAAALIYHGLGPQFREVKLDAMKAYDEAMKIEKFRVDKDNDGKASVKEKTDFISMMRR